MQDKKFVNVHYAPEINALKKRAERAAAERGLTRGAKDQFVSQATYWFIEGLYQAHKVQNAD